MYFTCKLLIYVYIEEGVSDLTHPLLQMLIVFVVSTCKIHSFRSFKTSNILLNMVPMIHTKSKLCLIALFPSGSLMEFGNFPSMTLT